MVPLSGYPLFLLSFLLPTIFALSLNLTTPSNAAGLECIPFKTASFNMGTVQYVFPECSDSPSKSHYTPTLISTRSPESPVPSPRLQSHPLTPHFLCFYRNCAAAILTLPQTSQLLTFHRAGPPHPGRLPLVESVGDCTVAVDLPFAHTEVSTWATIGLAASSLMTACTDVQLNHPYTAGYAITGDEREIHIALLRNNEGVGSGRENGSVSTGAGAVGSA